ncbi:sialidase family protein [Geminisphaera colitermitum]|uniref:sialidase family protein n=1 Tax=Geminisphaera colitermitum TaxID=1148786 RepID=UPI001E5CEFD2|nr:sialidase family protein [Geminisphaera colitermitum]
MTFTEVHYQDPATKTYLGSPSLVRLPDGTLLATHDYFGPGSPGAIDGEGALTSLHRSTDNGRTWRNVSHLDNIYWATLFLHRGALWLLGCSRSYGAITIRRSDDGGNTWTRPKDSATGLLFPGGPRETGPNYHGAPVPILVHGGRIYRAFEDCTPRIWGRGFQALVISAPEDADLLDAANWTMSNKIPFDPAWAPRERWGGADNPGWLEGNIVAAPDGSIWNILRVNAEPMPDQAARLRVSNNGLRLDFDPATGFFDFPGGTHKFTIHRDPCSGLYITLSNPAAGCIPASNGVVKDVPFLGVSRRNILALCTSPDLWNWSVCATLLADDLPLNVRESYEKTGFQYVDWHFDGDDIIYLVRVGYDGAPNFHDSNRITFHRLWHYAEHLRHPVPFKARPPCPPRHPFRTHPPCIRHRMTNKNPKAETPIHP